MALFYNLQVDYQMDTAWMKAIYEHVLLIVPKKSNIDMRENINDIHAPRIDQHHVLSYAYNLSLHPVPFINLPIPIPDPMVAKFVPIKSQRGIRELYMFFFLLFVACVHGWNLAIAVVISHPQQPQHSSQWDHLRHWHYPHEDISSLLHLPSTMSVKKTHGFTRLIKQESRTFKSQVRKAHVVSSQIQRRRP